MFPPSGTSLKPALQKPGVAIGLILLCSLVARIVFVYYFTDYPAYLHSDAGGYWERAHIRFSGAEPVLTQWWVWPPFNHIALSGYLHLLNALGLYEHRLEATLMANILLSVAMVFLFYRTAGSLGISRGISLLLSAFLAFFYPLVYFNAFVLAEGPALFFLMLGLYFLFCRKTLPGLLLSGACIVLSAAFKPAMGITALPIGIYLLLTGGAFRQRFINAFIFSAGFFLVFTAVSLENYRISDGELKGLGGAGGINFFMKQCQVHRLEYNEPGLHYNFVPAMTHDRPELGVFVAEERFHVQAYYFELAMRCVEANPALWAQNAASLASLFFGPLYPSYSTASGFDAWMPSSRAISLALFLASIIISMALIGKTAFGHGAVLLGVSLSMLPVFYFLNVDHRHVYGLLPSALLITGLGMQHLPGRTPGRQLLWALLLAGLAGLLARQAFVHIYPWLKDYRGKLVLEYADLRTVPENGSPWNTPGFYKLFEEGMEIRIAPEMLENSLGIAVSLDNNDRYEVSFWSGDNNLGDIKLGPVYSPNGGMHSYEIMLSEDLRKQSINRIRIRPLEGDNSYSLGGLQLIRD